MADPLDETDSPEPDLLLGSVPPPAPGTNTSLLQAFPVPTTADPLDETDSPEPDPLLDSVPPPTPGTNASLHGALVVATTARPLDETDVPDLPLSSSSLAAPSINASLLRAFPVPTTADPLDETDSPEPDPLLDSVPPPTPGTNASLHGALVVATTARPLDETDVPDLPLSSSSLAAPSINASLLRAFPVPTTADPLDETDSPDPDLLQGSVPPPAPSTEAAPQKSITTIPSWLTSPSEEETVAGGTDSTSSALGPTTTGYKKGRDPPTATHSTAWDMKPWGTAVPVPWDPSRMMGKCLLAILLLALVAATFMVCTGVLGTLLWRRGRMAHHRLAPTEMVCISSLLPDGETVANGPKPIPLRRQKLLLDGGSEADGDNLTLSSFLPEHS
ncbi:PREDICTED: P-selectin glycoprotein ligand 1 [Calidris pugnax]|uniref:P-selectin glycoprotein ligand 1 n=1 Tax=Calidris pugnax TaxID=198806 RepID=UPI00071D90EA|nr:PREDICTED: P-selectin glycoprotein ligand 1 [Calidris pugnax]